MRAVKSRFAYALTKNLETSLQLNVSQVNTNRKRIRGLQTEFAVVPEAGFRGVSGDVGRCDNVRH
jgi:hypothetical protein